MSLEAAAPCQTSNMLKRRGQREKETVTISLLGVSPRQLAQRSLAKFLCQIRRKLAKDLSPERTKAGTATNADP
jgi:ATP/maltotriose-dependent transcriptional regulator MalT